MPNKEKNGQKIQHGKGRECYLKFCDQGTHWTDKDLKGVSTVGI